MSPEAKAYQEEIHRRGALDRRSGRGLDENPYRAVSHGWPELHLDALRLIKRKSSEQIAEIRAAFDRMSEQDQQKVLSNPKVASVQTEIGTIRDHAHQLWEQGWLTGRSPGEDIDLDDLISGD